MTATGRQYGPDFILKVDSGIKTLGDPKADDAIPSIAELINNKSTISLLYEYTNNKVLFKGLVVPDALLLNIMLNFGYD